MKKVKRIDDSEGGCLECGKPWKVAIYETIRICWRHAKALLDALDNLECQRSQGRGPRRRGASVKGRGRR